jgi:glycine cleavage system H protein
MYYTATHDWIKFDQDDVTLAKVGISDFAQKEIGEIVFIELPKVGSIIQKGEPVTVIESTKAAIDIYAIASGQIIAVNEDLRKNSSLMNKAPEGEGWIYFIRLHEFLSPPDRFGLLTPNGYRLGGLIT